MQIAKTHTILTPSVCDNYGSLNKESTVISVITWLIDELADRLMEDQEVGLYNMLSCSMAKLSDSFSRHLLAYMKISRPKMLYRLYEVSFKTGVIYNASIVLCSSSRKKNLWNTRSKYSSSVTTIA